MARNTEPLNYTPVLPSTAVADIITASEDAKLLAKARRLISGREEMGGLPDEPIDPTAGFTPEEWLSGIKGFYTNLREAQAAKPKSQTLGKDIARGVAANTIGLLVPPLRERAIEGMSPVGQTMAELLNPTNWEGSLAAAPLAVNFASRIGKLKRFGATVKNAVVKQSGTNTWSVIPPRNLLQEELIRSSRQTLAGAGAGADPQRLRVSGSGDLDIKNLVDWARTNSAGTFLSDNALVGSSPGEVLRRASTLERLGGDYLSENSLAMNYLLRQGKPVDVVQNFLINRNDPLANELYSRVRTPKGALGVSSTDPEMPNPTARTFTTIRNANDMLSEARSLVHETGHAIHGQFSANLDTFYPLIGGVTMSDASKIINELRTNIRRMNPHVTEGATASAGYNWLDSPAEMVAEAMVHVVGNKKSAADLMPLTTKLFEDISAKAKAYDIQGRPRKFPIEFVPAMFMLMAAVDKAEQAEPQ